MNFTGFCYFQSSSEVSSLSVSFILDFNNGMVTRNFAFSSYDDIVSILSYLVADVLFNGLFNCTHDDLLDQNWLVSN